eukprot:6195877-Pleurochrysis_carterae.AAC.2
MSVPNLRETFSSQNHNVPFSLDSIGRRHDFVFPNGYLKLAHPIRLSPVVVSNVSCTCIAPATAALLLGRGCVGVAVNT